MRSGLLLDSVDSGFGSVMCVCARACSIHMLFRMMLQCRCRFWLLSACRFAWRKSALGASTVGSTVKLCSGNRMCTPVLCCFSVVFLEAC